MALLLCVSLAAPAAAEWRRIDGPNFVVIGDAGARELRDIAVKSEAFRDTLGRILSEGAISAPRFNGRIVDAAGLFVARPDKISAASRSSPRARASAARPSRRRLPAAASRRRRCRP